MVSTRLLDLASSAAFVVGALLVGTALRGSVVTGDTPLSAPATLVPLAVGLVVLAAGYAVERRVRRRRAAEAERAGESGADALGGPGADAGRPDGPDGSGGDARLAPFDGMADDGDARNGRDDPTDLDDRNARDDR